MILVHWKYAQMHQNTFSTTPDGQKYLFSEHFSGALEVCENASKHVFNRFRGSKISFLKKKVLVVWKYAQMHQNTFLTTPNSKKYIFSEHFSGGLKV
jgi:hypothetical protein